MVHHSYLSPDGRWVLMMMMNDKGDLIPCEVAPFAGEEKPQRVGPVEGYCVGGAWSPDGKYVYLSIGQKGVAHIWRQSFPGGEPEQVTFGPTSELGLTMASDGRSIVTSVGSRETSIWLHDSKGDTQVSSEGNTFGAMFSDDGKSLFYLQQRGQKEGLELWRRDLASGIAERVQPGISIASYAISHDGKRVAYQTSNGQGKASLWVAPLDHRSPPVQITSGGEDSPFFLPDGSLIARSSENGSNVLVHLSGDGTNRRRIGSFTIFDLHNVSPDGRWAIATVKGNAEEGVAIAAVPLAGGAPITICVDFCATGWDTTGHNLLIGLFGVTRPSWRESNTLILPVVPTTGLPKFPPGGLRTAADLQAVAARAIVIPHPVSAVFSPSLYAVQRNSSHRNLYRIPLP